MDHVGRLHLELGAAVERKHELVRLDPAVVRVDEAPGELLGEDLDVERVRACLAFFERTNALSDADRDDEDRRNDRPRDLEPGVAVDRRAVGLVLGGRRETP